MQRIESTTRRSHAALAAIPLLLGISVTSCADDPDATPTAAAGATFEAGPFTVMPGEERVICTYVRSDNHAPEDVTRFATEQTQGGHHLIVYAVDHAIDLPPTECSQGGQPSWRQILASQIPREEHTFPEGVGYRIAPRQQFVIETHYINPSAEPLEVEGAFSMTYAEPGAVTTQAASYFIGTMNIDIPPNAAWSKSVACTPPSEVYLHTMFGHEHRRGTGLRVDLARSGGAAEPLYATTEWEAPPIERFDGGLRITPGDTIQVTCDWQNDSPERLRHPHEMCFAVGYYWPAEGSLMCVSGGQNDECLCFTQGNVDAGPGGARVDVSVRREETIAGAGGDIDTGAPIYCLLFRDADWTAFGPKEGAMPHYVRDAVDVALETTEDVATFAFDDVTPGDYVVSCLMDTIGGGFMPGTGDVVNSLPVNVTAAAGAPAEAAVVLNLALP